MIKVLFSFLDKQKNVLSNGHFLASVMHGLLTSLLPFYLYPEDPSAAAHVGGRSNLFGQKTQS